LKKNPFLSFVIKLKMSETTEAMEEVKEVKPEAMEEVKPEVTEEKKKESVEETKPVETKQETVEETKPEEIVHPEIENPREMLCDFWSKLHEKQWIFPSGGSLTLRSGEEIYMTPKMISPFELKPDEMYVFDNEDKDDITEAPEHLEISNDAQTLMEIYKLRKPGAILHSVHCKAMIVSHLFRGNEYRLRYHAMIEAVMEAKECEKYGTDNTRLAIPIVYDPKKLSEKLKVHPQTPAVLIKGQGLFVWGKDLNECIFRTEAFHQMFEFSIEMEKHGVNDHKNFTPKSPVKKPVENGTKKSDSTTNPVPTNQKKNEKKTEGKKFIARRPAAENGVKTGRVKKNFKNNRPGNVGNFRNKNAPNNKGNSGTGGVQVWQNFGNKKQKQQMNVIMNY